MNAVIRFGAVDLTDPAPLAVLPADGGAAQAPRIKGTSPIMPIRFQLTAVTRKRPRRLGPEPAPLVAPLNSLISPPLLGPSTNGTFFVNRFIRSTALRIEFTHS